MYHDNGLHVSKGECLKTGNNRPDGYIICAHSVRGQLEDKVCGHNYKHYKLLNEPVKRNK